jgi:hypothetical protein
MAIKNVSLQAHDFMIFARFEVLTAVVMKSAVVWDITPCSPLKIN